MAEAAPANRAKSVVSRYLDERGEIVRVIKVLRDQRAEVQLRFEDDSEAYTAKVLDVLETSLLLDDVRPRSGLSHLRTGKSFSLAARVHGMYAYSATNHAFKSEAERGVPYFHVALPVNLLYQQRRNAARFRLPLRVTTKGACVTLTRSHDEKIAGRVIDISAGGCRVQFDGLIEVPLAAEEQVGCAISIPKLLDLDGHGIVRHVSYDEQTRKLTCGIELTEMNVTDRRRLEQFIQSLAKISQAV